MHKIGMVLVIFVSCVTTFGQPEDDKTLNLKIGFDLTRGENGAPSLQIRNFEDFGGRKFNEEKKKKEYLRTPLSSQSDVDETVHEKIASEIRESKESHGSDDVETSAGSDEDQRLSTKGIMPDEFEPLKNPSVHVRIDEGGSDSE